MMIIIFLLYAVSNITSTSASASVATTSEIEAMSMSPSAGPALAGIWINHRSRSGGGGCCGFPGGWISHSSCCTDCVVESED